MRLLGLPAPSFVALLTSHYLFRQGNYMTSTPVSYLFVFFSCRLLNGKLFVGVPLEAL